MFTLAQLRCFTAVATEMNFRRAAAALHMTQPPLSRQIQLLEQEVGVALVDRSGRAIRLTPAGESFARTARYLLDSAAAAALDARRIASGDAGILTIGFTAASSYAFLPRFVSLLRRRLPDLALTLREMTTPQQVAALQSGLIDLGVLRPPVTLAGMQVVRVHREGLALAVPRGHRLAGQAAVGLADLEGEALITYPPVEGPYFHQLIMGLLRAAGVAPGSVQHITQTHSILALVAAGLGMALVPQTAARFSPPEIVLRTLEGLDTVTADLMVATRMEALNPACATVMGLLGSLG